MVVMVVVTFLIGVLAGRNDHFTFIAYHFTAAETGPIVGVLDGIFASVMSMSMALSVVMMMALASLATGFQIVPGLTVELVQSPVIDAGGFKSGRCC